MRYLIGTILQLREAVQLLVHVLGQLEPLPPPEEAAVLEHVEGGGMQRPEGALPGAVRPPGDLDEAVVEGEVVAEGVLPALRVAAVVREAVGDEAVDLGERQHLLRGTPYGHGRQGDVRIGRFLVSVRLARRPRHIWKLHSADVSQTPYIQ